MILRFTISSIITTKVPEIKLRPELIILLSTLNFNFIDAPYYQLGTLNNKTKVNDLTILNNVLYAATVSGVAYANLINANLNNPASWTSYIGYPLNANVRAIEAFDNKVFTGSDEGFQYFDGNNWIPYPNGNVSDTNIIYIKAISNNLYFIANRDIYYAQAGALQNLIKFQSPGSYNSISADNNSNPAVGSSDNGSLLSFS